MIDIEVIAHDVISKLNFTEIYQIQESFEDELIHLHHGLGTWIRNEYKLWENGWNPEIKDGVDYSEDHPDAISMKIVRRIWEILDAR